jgi:Ca2+-binding RTX toxin-like protein
MRELVETGTRPDDYRVILHEWEISIRPPPPPPPPGGGGGPGTAQGPRSPNTRICTIDGTARSDTLVGTPDNDVICGFGGDDVIRGRGGHDIVYGSFGDDRIIGGGGLDSLLGNSGDDLLLAKDRRPDFVHGGPNFDQATRDRRLDKLRSVERRR